MLRLKCYNLDISYKPSPDMYIADHLSRASVLDVSTPGTEFQVFALELEAIRPLTTVKVDTAPESRRTGPCDANIENKNTYRMTYTKRGITHTH